MARARMPRIRLIPLEPPESEVRAPTEPEDGAPPANSEISSTRETRPRRGRRQ